MSTLDDEALALVAQVLSSLMDVTTLTAHTTLSIILIVMIIMMVMMMMMMMMMTMTMLIASEMKRGRYGIYACVFFFPRRFLNSYIFFLSQNSIYDNNTLGANT